MIDRWPDWPHHVLLIAGPQGSGKTHLVNVWRKRSGGEIIEAAGMTAANVADLGRDGGVILEDIDRETIDEHAFFHLINLAKEKNFQILLTARTMPGQWQVTLPDLRSRLRSLALVDIGTPDEVLLKTVMVKLFADRQLAIHPQVIDYVALRMERSMEWAGRFVEETDKAALATGRKVSRAIAAQVIEALAK